MFFFGHFYIFIRYIKKCRKCTSWVFHLTRGDALKHSLGVWVTFEPSSRRQALYSHAGSGLSQKRIISQHNLLLNPPKMTVLQNYTAKTLNLTKRQDSAQEEKDVYRKKKQVRFLFFH